PLRKWIHAVYQYAVYGFPERSSKNFTAYVLLERYVAAMVHLAEDDVLNAYAGLPGDRNWCSWWEAKSPMLRSSIRQPGTWKIVGSILGVWHKGGLERWEEHGEEDADGRGSKRWKYVEWRRETRSVRVSYLVDWM